MDSDKTYELKILSPEEARPCGDCQACCSTMAVMELAKENYTRCEHQCPGGCAIYQDRPPSCQSYECWYRAGLVKDRPDKIGVIVDYNVVNDVIFIWEVRPGATKNNRVKKLMKSLRKRYPGPRIHVVHRDNCGSLADSETPEAKAYERKAKAMAKEMVEEMVKNYSAAS